MAKKLRGDFFFLSANDLKNGDIVFYGDHGWTSQFDRALKIPRNKIESIDELKEILFKKFGNSLK